MDSNYQSIPSLEKKKSNERKYVNVLLVVGIIFCVGFLSLWYQGFLDSSPIIESQYLASSKNADNEYLKLENLNDNMLKTENGRFGDAINGIPAHIEPPVSESILENFDQIPKPSKVDSKEP